MDGLQGYIRQAMVMQGTPDVKPASVSPAMPEAARYTSVLEQLKLDRSLFATDMGVTFRQDENRWWNL